jgi:uncharacterized Tic20 family protein
MNSTISTLEKNLSVIIHLSVLFSPYTGGVSLLVPAGIWLYKRDSLFVDAQFKVALNGVISYLIYSVVFIFLCLMLIGFPLLLILFFMTLIEPIRAATKASQGNLPKSYALSLKLFTSDFNANSAAPSQPDFTAPSSSNHSMKGLLIVLIILVGMVLASLLYGWLVVKPWISSKIRPFYHQLLKQEPTNETKDISVDIKKEIDDIQKEIKANLRP